MIVSSTKREADQLALPSIGHYVYPQDGNLALPLSATGPVPVVVGTASKGPSNPFLLSKDDPISAIFGTTGTLPTALSDVFAGGANFAIPLRVGASQSNLTGVGGSGSTIGYTVVPEQPGDEIDVKLWYNRKTKTIQCWNSGNAKIWDDSPRCINDRDPVSMRYYGKGLAAVDGSTVVITDLDRLSTNLGLRKPWGDDALNGYYVTFPGLSDDVFLVTDSANGRDLTNQSTFTFADDDGIVQDATTYEYIVGEIRTRCQGNFVGVYGTIDTITYDGTNTTTITMNDYDELQLEAGSFRGLYLNPNIDQGQTFLITGNTYNVDTWEFTVQGDATGVASQGDIMTAGNWRLLNAGTTISDTQSGTRCGNKFCSFTACPKYKRSFTDTGEVSVSLVGDIEDLTSIADIGGPGFGSSDLPAPVPLDNVIAAAANEGITTSGMTFVLGTDGVNITQRKLYEVLYTALHTDLLGVEADVIYVPDAVADSLNVKWCEVDSQTGEYKTTDDNYPGLTTEVAHTGTYAFTKPNTLGWVSVYEHTDGRFYYLWSNKVQPDTTDVTMYTSDQLYSLGVGTGASDPISTIEFHEADFTHLIGMYCYENSRDIRMIRALIPFKPPKSVTAAGIAEWVGREPKYDITSGNDVILENGKGLLGFPYKVGKIVSYENGGFVNFPDGTTGVHVPGYYATSNGFPDGTILTDNGGRQVDIGKYMALVAGVARLPSLAYSGVSYRNAAGRLAGQAVSIPITRSFLWLPSGLSIGYRINHRLVQKLNRIGIIALAPHRGTIVWTNSRTAAMPDSDYTTWQICTSMMETVRRLRNAADSYFGSAFGPEQYENLKKDFGLVATTLKTDSIVRDVGFKYTSSALEIIRGIVNMIVTIIPVGELQRISMEVKFAVTLEADNDANQNL